MDAKETSVKGPPGDGFCRRVDLPITDYTRALHLQRRIVAAKKAGRLEEDVALVLEHPPVFTLGRNGGRENLIVSEEFLERRSIQVVQIERGGNITFHGPGQLVIYPILGLNRAGLGVRAYVGGLEEAMVRTAADWGLQSAGDEANRGVWIDGKKLGSIGVAVTRGVSFHGLAFNVNLSLEPFSWINPCGIRNCRMTSLMAELSRKIPMDGVREAMTGHLADIFGIRWRAMDPKDLENRLDELETN